MKTEGNTYENIEISDRDKMEKQLSDRDKMEKQLPETVRENLVPLAGQMKREAGPLIRKMDHFLRAEIMPGGKYDREASRQSGKALRKTVKRSAHAAWTVQKGRTAPIAILEEQEKTRKQQLLSIRHERMAASAFAYYRGTAAVMAADLAKTPVTGIMVQACGDAHIGNFGFFSSAERRMVFDINDFDETYPGPWEWDVKRLAASIEVCARYRGFSDEDRGRAVRNSLDAYHDAMTSFSAMGTMDVWYSHLDIGQLQAEHRGSISHSTGKMIDKVVADAVTKNSWRAVHKWTEMVDGRLQIRSIPPILVPYRDMPEMNRPDELEKFLRLALTKYRLSLPREVRKLIDQYTPVDVAQKVVGVGSVGMRSYIMVMEGDAVDDPLVLQFKEAGDSVLARYVRVEGQTMKMADRKTGDAVTAAESKSVHGADGDHDGIGAEARGIGAVWNRTVSGIVRRDNGMRVVTGQKAIQTAGDILLGWMRVPDMDGTVRDFYVRQLWNNKGTIDLTTVSPDDLAWLAGVCGWTLAHAHARTGDRHAIAGYLGKSRKFEEAVAAFAVRYADQNEADYEEYVKRYGKKK